MSAKHKRIKFVYLLMAVFIISAIGTYLCKAKEQKSVLGELKIEGHYISELVLCLKDGHIETFTTPNEELNEILKLPIGEYRLMMVRLRGEYTAGYATSIPVRDWIKVTENKQAALKAGAPLGHAVNVRKQGNFLVMDYQLKGVGGQIYRDGRRENNRSCRHCLV
jgi:hypothetical protein